MTNNPTPPRRSTDRRDTAPKPAKRGTPVRNGILLLLFAGVLALLVLLLPKEPTRPTAALLAPGSVAADAVPEDLPLRISEVMASNRNAYPDETGSYPDWVEIENTSAYPVSLDGVGLSDREDRVLFLFPAIELAPSGRIVVFCDDTNANAKDAPLHARFKISSLGETVYLFDRTATLLDSVEVPALTSDYSYALTDGGWIITDQYTPGYPNDADGHEAFRASAISTADGLVLNEMVASNRTTLADEDGEYSDWIELYNGGDTVIDLSYFALSDDESEPVKWRFPQGETLAPGAYYLVFASGKDRPGGAGLHPHTNFRLGAEGETVVLSDIMRQTIDRTTYDNLGKDQSWGRVEGTGGDWQVYQQPTPGMPNNRQSEIEMDARMRASNQTGVFISEVVATVSDEGLETPYGFASYDWIELVNLGNDEVDLSGWGLSDNIGRPRKWQFKAGTVLRPGEYMLVFPSGYLESPVGSDAIHADFRLSALGETIVLADPTGSIVDKLVVPKLERNNAYGRDFDQGGLFYYETPTAAAKNTAQGFSGYAQAPSISLSGGLFQSPITVEISAPQGVHIRYTLDGSDPTETKGDDYTGPITLSEPTPLRARGFVPGLKASDIVTETYLVNVYHALPVIALTTDPDNLWNMEDGMLAEDPLVRAEYEALGKAGFKNLTYWKKVTHPGNFEFFTPYPEGNKLMGQGVDLKLNGQYSMDQAQKSFRVTARARYGSSVLSYPFFDDRPFTEYNAVILRNGGQDGKYTRIIDALQSKIVDWTDSTVIHMASTPVIMYLNGEYYGHYNLRERINKYAIAAYEGIEDPTNIDFIKGDNDVISGTFTNYRSLRDFVRSNDLNDPENLQTVLDWVDVDNYFDFIIFEIYFGNTDPGNIKYYRERTADAKWRWVLFDLDWGYFQANTNGCNVWLNEQGAGAHRFDNSLIRALLQVPAMRDKFLTRFGQLFQETLSDTARITQLAEEMIAEIEPELTPLHFQRWAGLTSKVISEEPADASGLEGYWRSQQNRMYNVFKKRPHYAWQDVKNWFRLSDEQMESYFGPQPPMPADAIVNENETLRFYEMKEGT